MQEKLVIGEKCKSIVDFRLYAKTALANYYGKVVQPFITACREKGMTDEEINDAFGKAIQPYMVWNERPYTPGE